MEWVVVKYGDRVLAGRPWGKSQHFSPLLWEGIWKQKWSQPRFQYHEERRGSPGFVSEEGLPIELESGRHCARGNRAVKPWEAITGWEALEQAFQKVLAQKTMMQMKFSPPDTAAVLLFSHVRVKARVSRAGKRPSPEHNMILSWWGCETRIKSPWQTVWVCVR